MILNLKSVNGEVIKVKVKQDPASVITGNTAITDATNLGGVGLFAQKNSTVLEFKGLVAGSNITLSESSTGVTINSSGGGSPTGGTPIDLFTGYTASTETTLQSIDNELDLTITGVTNLGTGENILSVVGRTIADKSLIAGSNITLTPSSTGLTISSTGGGSPTGGTPIYLFTGYTASTASILSGLENDIDYISGVTNTKVNQSLFNNYTGDTQPILDGALTGATAGSNLAVNISNRLLNIQFTGSTDYVSNSTFNTYTGNTANILSGLDDDIDYISGVTNTKVNQTLFNTYTGNTATELNDINNELDLTITGATAGSNLAVSISNRVLDIQFTGSTGGGDGAYLPLSGGTVTGDTNFSSGINVYGDIVSMTGATTLDATYAGLTIEANGTFTITLPNSMVTGMKVTIVNVGTGVITIAASGTMKSLDSRNKLRFQYAGASAYHRGSNDWMVIGNLQE